MSSRVRNQVMHWATKRRYVIATMLTFAAAAPGCGPSPDRTDGDTTNGERGSRVDSVLSSDSAATLAALRDVGTSFGRNRAALVASLGAPRRSTTDTTANRHGYGIDSLFVLDFDGLSFSLRQPAQSTNELLEWAELTDSARALPGDIVIGGASLRELRAKLGKPQEQGIHGDTVRLTYLVSPDGGEDFLRFDFVGELLRRVVWTFYVD